MAPRARVLALSARSGAGFSALRAALGLGLARDLAPVALPVLQP